MTFDTTLRPDPFIGRTFGAYRLTERIREVRVGAAFIAEHRHLDRHVVLKLFQPAPPGTAGGGLPSVEARLRVLSRSWHEHVLPLVDVGEGDDGLVFVALGLEDDVPLTSLSAHGAAAVPWARARVIGRQVAGAIRWAESQGIPLGELGPAQVFVLPPAGAAARGGRAAVRARIDLVTPEALGLVAPPGRVDWAFDVGRVLYWLVTGQSPGGSAEAPPTDPILKRPDLDIPGEADALIMRALDPDPRKRWPDLASLHRALGGRDDEIGVSRAAARRSTGTGAGAAAGAAWFASEGAPGAGQVAVDLLDAPVPAAIDADIDAADDGRELGGGLGDGEGDRFGVDFETDYEDQDGRHGSFGSRGLFARPSRRAMISVGVAGAVALAIAVIVIRARGHSAQGAGGEVERQEKAEKAEEVRVDAARAPAIAGPPSSDPGSGVAGSAAGETVGALPPGDAEVAGQGPANGGAVGTASTPSTVAASSETASAGEPAASPEASATVHAPGPGALAAPTPSLAGNAPRAGAAVASAAPAGPEHPASPASAAPHAPEVMVPAAGPTATRAVGSAAVPSAVPGPDPGVGATPAGAPFAGAPPTAADSAERPSPGTLGTPPGQPAPAPGSPSLAPAPAPAADANGRCSLSLGSKPWADVWIDGRRVGLTPLTDLPIACGPHEVVFTSTDLGLERRISVNVQPGDRTRRILDLEAPPPVPGDLTVAPAAGRAARPECRLSLGSRPWSEVWIDGRRAGVTPLVSVAVRCGRHDVLFVSREANVERRETIFVSEGQNVKRIVTLVEGE